MRDDDEDARSARAQPRPDHADQPDPRRLVVRLMSGIELEYDLDTRRPRTL